MRRLAALLLATSLATTPACAHWQPTRKQVGITIIGAAVVTILIILAVSQCRKGAASCDETNTQ
jgi:hypothetical protein